MSERTLEKDKLYRARHSAAHLMAAAIEELWPGTRFGVGPPIEGGFYYDVDVPGGLVEADLKAIEKRMKKIRGRKAAFTCETLAVDEAHAQMEAKGQTFKLELIEALKTKGSTAVRDEFGGDLVSGEGVKTVTFYTVAGFVDLCAGPHVEDTSEIPAFSLDRIAGAYWRGDERNPQLQRIYGLCFETEEEIGQYRWEREQRRLRDHRKLAQDLEIFTLNEDVGKGLPLWLPHGVTLRMELEALAEETERRYGYQRVVTPNLAKEDLFVKSGHLPYYKDDMYAPIKIDEETYYLKPMNCPFHHKIFAHRPRSFRELPVRIAEHGTVYRYEASGALTGLMRTRGFTQNDGHIYCSEAQAKEEFLRVMTMHAEYYEALGIEDFYMLLAKPDMENQDKFVDQPEAWLAALEIIESAMKDSGLPYEEGIGEAAFYGPKVDFMIKSVIGTSYAISTNQLDFLSAQRFDLHYIGSDGAEHPVYVIHRAPLGSHERFVAFLLEHYAGKFPTWLAPVQVKLVPITEHQNGYAWEVARKLESSPISTGTGGLRVEVDDSVERMQKKIRNAQMGKVPYILVVGAREAEEGTVAVRLRDGEDLGAMSLDALTARLGEEISTRRS